MDVHRNWKQVVGALCGAVFVILVLAGDNGERPAEGATDAEVAAFFSSHPPVATTWMSLFAELVGLLAFVLFVSTVSDRLARSERSGTILSRTAFAAGVITVAVKIASFPLYSVIQARAEAGQVLDPAVTGAMYALNNAAFTVTWATIALLLLAVGWGAIADRALPRWLGWFAFADALALLQGFADQTNPLGVFAYLGFLLWTVITSIVLTRDAWRQRGQPAPLATRAEIGPM